jgi:hypothetical protein
MFKFLKDFLFEENEVAVATPTATAAVTSMDEKMDQGARSTKSECSNSSTGSDCGKQVYCFGYPIQD